MGFIMNPFHVHCECLPFVFHGCPRFGPRLHDHCLPDWEIKVHPQGVTLIQPNNSNAIQDCPFVLTISHAAVYQHDFAIINAHI